MMRNTNLVLIDDQNGESSDQIVRNQPLDFILRSDSISRHAHPVCIVRKQHLWIDRHLWSIWHSLGLVPTIYALEAIEPKILRGSWAIVRYVKTDVQSAMIQPFWAHSADNKTRSKSEFVCTRSSVSSILRGPHLEDVDDEQSESNQNSKFLPKWSALFAPIGAFGIWFTWDNVRDERRLTSSVIIFTASAILWMYGFAALITL